MNDTYIEYAFIRSIIACKLFLAQNRYKYIRGKKITRLEVILGSLFFEPCYVKDILHKTFYSYAQNKTGRDFSLYPCHFCYFKNLSLLASRATNTPVINVHIRFSNSSLFASLIKQVSSSLLASNVTSLYLPFTRQTRKKYVSVIFSLNKPLRILSALSMISTSCNG